MDILTQHCAQVTVLRLYMACKMWKITSLTLKFYISAFPMYYPLYNNIGEHEITKLKKKGASNPEEKDTKTSTKRHE